MLHISDRTSVTYQALVNVTLQKALSQSRELSLNAIPVICVDVFLSELGYFLGKIVLGHLVSHNRIVRRHAAVVFGMR